MLILVVELFVWDVLKKNRYEFLILSVYQQTNVRKIIGKGGLVYGAKGFFSYFYKFCGIFFVKIKSNDTKSQQSVSYVTNVLERKVYLCQSNIKNIEKVI